MGTFYFVLKSTVITFVLVSLLQIKLGSQTLEFRLMNLIRTDLAPMFLDKDKLQINRNSVEFSKEQLHSIKEKIKNSDALKNAKDGAKDMLLEEIQSLFQNEKNKDSQEEDQ